MMDLEMICLRVHCMSRVRLACGLRNESYDAAAGNGAVVMVMCKSALKAVPDKSNITRFEP